jgi:hypothetical protein
MTDDRQPDPWFCRHCGEGLDVHEHSSPRAKFYCPWHAQTWPRHPCHQWGLKTTGCAWVPDGVLTSRTRLGMLCCITYCNDMPSPEESSQWPLSTALMA